MEQALLFLFLGLAGSAGPAHFGMRVLSHRQQLDRGPGLRAGHRGRRPGLQLVADVLRPTRSSATAALRQFGNIAGVMGWITLLGVLGSAACIAAKAEKLT